MAKVVPVSDADYEKQKADLAKRCVTAEVTGEQPIRDAVTRESVELGGMVRLDPKSTNIEHLVRAGAIKLLAAEPKA